MGRITVFTGDDVHSKIIQNELERLSLPYTEISLVAFPSRLNDLKALINKTSVPQVFFNTRHVGGVAATLTALGRWKKTNCSSAIVNDIGSGSNRKSTAKNCRVPLTPLEFYKAEIAIMPDPTNTRLDPPPAQPEKPQRNDSESTKRKSRAIIALPDGTTTTVLDIMKKLKLTLPRQEHKYKKTTYLNAFTGAQAVETFQHMNLSPEDATIFAQYLLNENILDHVRADDLRNSKFQNSDDEVYCLQCDRYPRVLNSYRLWNEPEPPGNVMELVARLDKMLHTLECSSLNEQGKMDYDKLMKSNYLPEVDEAMCELQTIDLVSLKEIERKVFAINLYRVMFRYGLVKCGIVGPVEGERAAFLENVQFNVGGHLFSFQEWANGILRANKPVNSSASSSSKTAPLGRLDARRKYALLQLDHRVHFAIHAGSPFGATCSLPFRLFSVDSLEAELNEAARVYCDDESNFAINVNAKPMSVEMSNIFHCYRSDFAKSETELLEMISVYLDGYKKVDMKKLLADMKSVKIKYTDRAWDIITCQWPLFRKEQVEPKPKGVFAKLTRRFQPPQNPDNERTRLNTLRCLNLLDTLHEERFDRITRMAKEAFDVPIVFISLIDENRQWFKSTQWSCSLAIPTETGRDISFCGHAINNAEDDIFLIPNALEDDRFAENPLVTGPVSIRFYAGYALSVPCATGGPPVYIGTLCIIDQKPRNMSDAELDQLRSFGDLVKREIIRRRDEDRRDSPDHTPPHVHKNFPRENSATSLESSSSSVPAP